MVHKHRFKTQSKKIKALYAKHYRGPPGSGPDLVRRIRGEPLRGDLLLTTWKMVYGARDQRQFAKHYTARALDNDLNILHFDGDRSNLAEQHAAGNITAYRVLRLGQTVSYKAQPWTLVEVGAKMGLRLRGGRRVNVDPNAINWDY